MVLCNTVEIHGVPASIHASPSPNRTVSSGSMTQLLRVESMIIDPEGDGDGDLDPEE